MNIWVFAQAANGAPTTGTLELLTKARGLGTVTAFVGGDASAIAAELGELRRRQGVRHRRSRRQAARRGRVGRHEGRHRRRRLARPHPVPAELRGPRRRQPPVGEAGSHRPHQQRRHHRRRRLGQRHDADLRWQRARHHRLLGRSPAPRGVPSEELRRRAVRWRRRPKSVAAPVPELGATGTAQVNAVHVEETSGPKLDEAAIVVSGGRGLGEAAEVRDDRDARQAAQGCARRQPCHRRRRLGAVQLPGRPDRQGRQAGRVHRRRHLAAPPSTWSA